MRVATRNSQLGSMRVFVLVWRGDGDEGDDDHMRPRFDRLTFFEFGNEHSGRECGKNGACRGDE